MQVHYRSARGRPVFFEEVTASHHWRQFFEPIATRFTGIVGAETTSSAAHVLRVVRRDMVRLCVPEVAFDEPGLPNDPVLLAKHWLRSKGLSQPPTLLMEGDLSFGAAVASCNAGT